jgi:hypothetical protein
VLNLFYEEPDDDRWFPFDRYPRRVLRRMVRGRPRVGGQRRVFLNLVAGLQKVGVPYRVNDYAFAKSRPSEPVGILGKRLVLDKLRWRNPIVCGPALHSHPVDDPDLASRLPVRKILVPGEWMRRMCEPYWGDKVIAWPVGIDTDRWSDTLETPKTLDVLIYDKIHWTREDHVPGLLEPIKAMLRADGLTFQEIRYGSYRDADFHALLGRCRAMIFLCQHETQGIAYQQALARGVPVFAWDPGGCWPDPEYYPHRVRFEPVTSVPYWDGRCGSTFRALGDFREQFPLFWSQLQAQSYSPRTFILENLTLEQCARRYASILESACEW